MENNQQNNGQNQNQNNGQNDGNQGAERMFSQADLDRIVQDRVARERQKYADYEELKGKAAKLDEYEEANKSEIEKATAKATALQAELDKMKQAETVRGVREKVAAAKGVPANLLHGATEDACTEEADELIAFAKKSGGYPAVKDGGEPNNGGGKLSNRDRFAAWFNEVAQ